MTLAEALRDKRNPRDIPDSELNEYMRLIRAAKCWAGNYYAFDAEQQRRAVNRWVKEDVFGHTFQS